MRKVISGSPFQAILLIGLLSSFLPCAWGAELNVGQKVVYPGANGGPPLEKDVGTKLKVQVLSVGSTSSPETLSVQDRMQEMLDAGSYEDILKQTKGRSDAVSRSFRALAFEYLSRPVEARNEAKAALQAPGIPDDLRDEMTRIVEDTVPVNDSRIASPSR